MAGLGYMGIGEAEWKELMLQVLAESGGKTLDEERHWQFLQRVVCRAGFPSPSRQLAVLNVILWRLVQEKKIRTVPIWGRSYGLELLVLEGTGGAVSGSRGSNMLTPGLSAESVTPEEAMLAIGCAHVEAGGEGLLAGILVRDAMRLVGMEDADAVPFWDAFYRLVGIGALGKKRQLGRFIYAPPLGHVPMVSPQSRAEEAKGEEDVRQLGQRFTALERYVQALGERIESSVKGLKTELAELKRWVEGLEEWKKRIDGAMEQVKAYLQERNQMAKQFLALVEKKLGAEAEEDVAAEDLEGEDDDEDSDDARGGPDAEDD